MSDRLIMPLNASLEMMADKLEQSPVYDPEQDDLDHDLAIIDTTLRVIEAFRPILHVKFGVKIADDFPVFFDQERFKHNGLGVAFVHQDNVTKTSAVQKCSEEDLAWLSQHKLAVGFNFSFARDWPKALLNEICRHELAHIVEFKVYALKGLDCGNHSWQWCDVMRKLGVKDPKDHRTDTSGRGSVRSKEVFKAHKLREK